MEVAAQLEAARKRQFMERETMMAQQAKAERDDFLWVIDRQKADELKERQLEYEKHRTLKDHSQVIR